MLLYVILRLFLTLHKTFMWHLLNLSVSSICVNKPEFLLVFFEQNKSPQGLVGLRNLGNTVSAIKLLCV